MEERPSTADDVAMSTPTKANGRKLFGKNIVGDIFSSSPKYGETALAGMIMESRSSPMTYRGREYLRPRDEKAKNGLNNTENLDPQSGKLPHNHVPTALTIGDDSHGLTDSMNPKQQLAITIKNWAHIPDNDENLLGEGAMPALNELSSIDDGKIKKNCAGAYYSLSTRKPNRYLMVDQGATTGLVNIALGLKSWQVAKLCAVAISNLSMEHGVEARMIKDSVAFALVILIGLEKNRLLPVCIQALYNITCVRDSFENMDRVTKIVISLPVLPAYDPTIILLKCIRNCARFSELRLRMVEEGALNVFAVIMSNFDTKEDKEELVFHMLTIYRSLAAERTVRTDMISKNCVEHMNRLVKTNLVTEEGYRLCIKSLHLLLTSTAHILPVKTFEKAVDIVTEITKRSAMTDSLQYCSECILMLTELDTCKDPGCVSKIIECVPKHLMNSEDTFTQYNSFFICGNIFFRRLCNNPIELVNLLQQFIKYGIMVKDPNSIIGLPFAMAKLSSEKKLFSILKEENLLMKALDLCLSILDKKPSKWVVQQCTLVALCRLAVEVKDVDKTMRDRIASNFTHEYLQSDNIVVLEATMQGLRSMLNCESYTEELLTDQMVLKVAGHLRNYEGNANICKACCEILTIVSYKESAQIIMSDPEIVRNLYLTGKTTTVEYNKVCICIVLCNISSNLEIAEKLIDMDIVEEVSNLSSASAHNEVIQEMNARIINNLTCVEAKHAQLIKDGIREIISMICQVRSIALETKHLCAQSIINFCRVDSFEYAIDTQVVRSVAQIVTTESYSATSHICARAFLILSSQAKGRKCLCDSPTNLQHLFGLVLKPSHNTKIVVAKATFNMLADPETRAVATKSNGLTVLKIVAAFQDEEENNSMSPSGLPGRVGKLQVFHHLREITAQVLMTLAVDRSLHDILIAEPIVNILILFLNQSIGFGFHCALEACALYASFHAFRVSMVDKGLITAIVGASLRKPREKHMKHCLDSIELATAALRTIALVSSSHHNRHHMTDETSVMVVLHMLKPYAILDVRCASLVALILHNISMDSALAPTLIEQYAIKLLHEIFCSVDYKKSKMLCQWSITVLQNLAPCKEYHERIMNEGYFMEVLLFVASLLGGTNEEKTKRGVHSCFDELDVAPIIKAIELIAETSACHLQLVDSGIVSTFTSLLHQLIDHTKLMIAKTIASIASSTTCRQSLVNHGAMDLIMNISKHADVETKSKCTLAIGYLSEYTHTAVANVSTMLNLVKEVEQTGNQAHGPSQMDTLKENRVNILRDVTRNAQLLEKVRRARIDKTLKMTRMDMKAAALAAGDDLSSSGDDLSDKDELFSNEIDEDAVYQTQDDVIDHIYTEFNYEYTHHMCEILEGSKARPVVLEATLPTINDDSSHADEFVYDGTMAEIEIEMEPLEKMNINYDVVHNDFTHDSYRAQEIASKNKKVANAVRMGAKLNLVVSAPTATGDYKGEVAAKVKDSNLKHNADNSYNSNLPNVPNYEALGMDEKGNDVNAENVASIGNKSP